MTGQGKSMTEWWCDQIIQGEWYDELIDAHTARRDRIHAEDAPTVSAPRMARLRLGGSQPRLRTLRQWLQRSLAHVSSPHTEVGR